MTQLPKITKVGNTYIVPPTLESHIPPKSLPFSGDASYAVLHCAEKRISQLLDLVSNQPESASAKLWLKMAVEFAEARAEVVESIVWQQAPEQTRFEVSVELIRQGELILEYLGKFKDHFNKAVEGVDLEAVTRKNLSELEQYELQTSWFFIDNKMGSYFSQKILKPRTRKRAKKTTNSAETQLNLFNNEKSVN